MKKHLIFHRYAVSATSSKDRPGKVAAGRTDSKGRKRSLGSTDTASTIGSVNDLLTSSTQLERLKEFSIALTNRFTKDSEYAGMEGFWNEIMLFYEIAVNIYGPDEGSSSENPSPTDSNEY